ncbi:proteinase inhibitor I3 [Tanacetum coccineum]|uniref:Proteinase inhibitor I3 n=1 Tax=Tanacetum coccineum TaxID=301880 RepID=A0ABQ5E9B6_9ASTR
MNKTTLFLLAFILFFALSANSAPSPSPVLDAYGKNLQTGVEYYVMPAARDGESGGLLYAAFINMKFGGLHDVDAHEHSVSFVAGTRSDGDCTKCLLATVNQDNDMVLSPSK